MSIMKDHAIRPLNIESERIKCECCDEPMAVQFVGRNLCLGCFKITSPNAFLPYGKEKSEMVWKD